MFGLDIVLAKIIGLHTLPNLVETNTSFEEASTALKSIESRPTCTYTTSIDLAKPYDRPTDVALMHESFDALVRRTR